MATTYTAGRFQAFDANGDPLSGGLLYTYAAGTTTPQATYTTSALSTPNANPVVLDSAGRASVWLSGSLSYRMVLKTSADATVTDDDNIVAPSKDVKADLLATTGAGLVGHDGSLTYADNTVGRTLAGLTANAAQWSVPNDGTTDATASIQEAVDELIASGKPWVLEFPAGDYKITDEIDLSAATEPYSIRGAGRDATIFRPTAFGTAKKMFKGADEDNPIYIGFRDFSIRGFGDTRDKACPIIFWFPDASRIMLSHISSASIGNTVIAAGPAFNSDWNNIELFTSGWQPIWKTIGSSVTFSTTSGSPTLTASASVFDSGDVGQTIYVRQTTGGSGNPSNSIMAAVISAYVSPTVVTLDRNAWFTSSDRSASFDSVKGTILSGGSTLTLNTDCLTSDDEGRIITIQGAGSGTGGMLSTKILTVSSGTVCIVEDAASSTATDQYVWFSPPIYLGREVTPDGLTPINDITLSDIHIEEYRGPAMILDQGTSVHLTRYKTHGRAPSFYNNFAESRNSLLINESTRVTCSQYLVEFGCFGVDKGHMLVTGSATSVDFDKGNVGGFQHGGYLFEFETASELAMMSIGTIQAPSIDWSKCLGVYKATGTTAARRVVSGGLISSTGFTEERSVAMPPFVAGMFRSSTPVSVADDTAVSIKTQRDQGFVLLSTDSTTHNGIFWFRTDGSPSLIEHGRPGTAALVVRPTGAMTGTTGTDGFMTISAHSDGKIYVENRLGATRTATFTFLGG